MPILTPQYRAALFLRKSSKEFDVSDLAGLPKVSKSGDGFVVRMGTRNVKCLVRPLARTDLIVLETDDTRTRTSAVRELRIFARGKGKPLERVTFGRPKILDFLRSFESDRMAKEGKLTVFYGDMGTVQTPLGPRERPRTKIAFNITDVDEARKISDRLAWEMRGFALTLTKGDRKNYAFVFFDGRPTCRITSAGRPTDADLHEELAKRLVNLM